MWKNFQEFLSSQLKGGLTPLSSLLEYDSVQSGSCGTKILVEFDLKFLYRSQTLLYNKTANLKPLYITRKVANPTNHQNLPNPMKIILLTLITPATSKIEFFMILVDSWKWLTNVTKTSVLDVAGVLDMLLTPFYQNTSQWLLVYFLLIL